MVEGLTWSASIMSPSDRRGPPGPLISQEQDARVGQLACGGLADGDQVFQRFSLLNRQGHLELLHLWISFPWATEAWMSIGKSIPDYPSTFD